MPLQLSVVDAFTDRPFAGNPAAVAIVEKFPDAERMQHIAMEMNLSETAFIAPAGADTYDLRWFTPLVEVDLCGHATLATTHVLGHAACFRTRSGELMAEVRTDGLIEMDFPADPPVAASAPDGVGLERAKWFGNGRVDALALFPDAEAVREFVPDLGAIKRLGTRGLIITAPGDREGFDCVSRFFAPGAGIAEDPATGSAHCTLAPFWSERLGRDSLTGEQASARGAVIHMRLNGDRVVLGGRAVTISQVTLLV
jgi:predicted PhzF superfamily epimerase YddE/YHI9